MTKKRKKSKFGRPSHEPTVSIGKESHAQEKQDHNQSSPTIASNIQPAPDHADKPQSAGKKSIPWQKVSKIMEVVGIAAGIFYAIVSFCMWRAMINANNMVRKTFEISQRAYVTIGRKDGIVASFITNESEATVGLIIYFANTGHIPAKINWGPLATALIPPIVGFSPQSPHKWVPMTRTRNKKDGSIGEGGGNVEIIGADSLYLGDVMQLPKERVSQIDKERRLLQIMGAYEYCDDLGNYSCRQFSIYYQGGPYQRFGLASEWTAYPK